MHQKRKHTPKIYCVLLLKDINNFSLLFINQTLNKNKVCKENKEKTSNKMLPGIYFN